MKNNTGFSHWLATATEAALLQKELSEIEGLPELNHRAKALSEWEPRAMKSYAHVTKQPELWQSYQDQNK